MNKFEGSVMSDKEPTYSDSEIAERLRDLPGCTDENGWIRRRTEQTAGRPR